jgi:hypothetical protein
MWSDRLERIATCMAELERIYAGYKEQPELAMIIAVGELDQLSELHRLVWEWDLWYTNVEGKHGKMENNSGF